jgi:hypothetical protein
MTTLMLQMLRMRVHAFHAAAAAAACVLPPLLYLASIAHRITLLCSERALVPASVARQAQLWLRVLRKAQALKIML